MSTAAGAWRCTPARAASREAGPPRWASRSSAQANMMERDTVPDAMIARLLRGGRRRPRRAAARGARGRRARGRRHPRAPVGRAGGRGGPRERRRRSEDRPVDLRVDDHPDPVARAAPAARRCTAPTSAREAGDELAGGRRPRGRARRVRGRAPRAARQRASWPSGTASRSPRNGREDEAARDPAARLPGSTTGWRELLERLPAAGLFPDDPELIARLAGTRAVSEPGRARLLGHVPRQGAHLRAGGAGGNGVVSFRREAHVPKGGPDGGDGGRGGDIAIVVDPSLRDLSGFRRGAHFKAARGGHGEGANRHGATPDTLEMRVPPGTVVEDVERGDRWELLDAGRARGRGARRQRRARQQAVRHRHAPDARASRSAGCPARSGRSSCSCG